MLKRSFQIRYQLDQMIDAVIAAVAFTLAVASRRWLTFWRPEIFVPFDALWNNAWLYMLMVPLWVFMLDFMGYYQHKFTRSPAAMHRTLLRANLASIMLIFFILYVLKLKYIPRALILVHGLFDIGLMWVKEMVSGRFEALWTQRSNILLVGRPRDLVEVARRIRQLPAWRVNVLGILAPSILAREGGLEPLRAEAAELPGAIPLLGTVDDLLDVLHRESVDFVALSPGREHFDEIEKTIHICETEGVETWMVAAFFRTSIARAHVDEFLDLPMLVFSSTPALSWALMLKRAVDFVGSLALILLFSPVMLAIAAAIRLTSPGPIFFKQQRCTLHGRTFWMHKFRTMVSEAENLRAELEAQNEMKGPVFKMRNDPRITRVGRILRRYSLDELPQLFNVLAGHMSLVGPRPPIPAEVAKYENWQRRRLSMRSGITCLWQVSGRNQLPFEDWMRLDLEYIDHWSIGLDFRILAQTPLAIVRGTGC